MAGKIQFFPPASQVVRWEFYNWWHGGYWEREKNLKVIKIVLNRKTSHKPLRAPSPGISLPGALVTQMGMDTKPKTPISATGALCALPSVLIHWWINESSFIGKWTALRKTDQVCEQGRNHKRAMAPSLKNKREVSSNQTGEQ